MQVPYLPEAREDFIDGTDHLTMAAASRRFPDAVVWLEHQLSDVLVLPEFRLRLMHGWMGDITGRPHYRLIAQWELLPDVRERRIRQDAARAVRRRPRSPNVADNLEAEVARRQPMRYSATATWVPAVGIWRRYCCDVRSNPRRPEPRPWPTKEAEPALEFPQHVLRRMAAEAELDRAYIDAGVMTPSEIARSRWPGVLED